MKNATTPRNSKKVPPVTQPEVWFLLDRSGSMQSIASDVVGGFNQFFAEQRAQAGELRVTVVQFDDQAPHEVLIDRADVAKVVDLDAHRYKPRGMTPLFDAIDLLLDRAERAQGSPSDQLVVVFTDGLENASHRVTRETAFARITVSRTPGGRSCSSAPTRTATRPAAASASRPGASPTTEPTVRACRWRSAASAGARANGAANPRRDVTPTAMPSGADARKPKRARRASPRQPLTTSGEIRAVSR